MFSYKYIFSNTIKIIQLNSNKKMNFQGGSSVKKPKIQLSQIIVFIILGGIAVISCLLHSNKPFDIENVSIFSDEKFYLTSYYLSSPYVFMILFILIFNFWNAHQSLIFLIGYEACVYFSSFFQLLFKKQTFASKLYQTKMVFDLFSLLFRHKKSEEISNFVLKLNISKLS